MKKIENFKGLTKSRRVVRRLPAGMNSATDGSDASAAAQLTLAAIVAGVVGFLLWMPLLYLAVHTASLWEPWVSDNFSAMFSTLLKAGGTLDFEKATTVFKAFFFCLVAAVGMIGTFLLICTIGSKLINKFIGWFFTFPSTSAESARTER